MMSVFFYFLFFFICYLNFGGLMIFSSLFLFSFLFFVYGFPSFFMLDMGIYDLFMYFDFYSFMMVVLTFWMFSLVFLISSFSMSFYLGLIYYFLFFSLVFSFFSSSIYLYYLFFEFSMFPIFILILYKGSGFDRLFSCYYMFMYTLISSIPSLFILFSMYSCYGLLVFNVYNIYGFNFSMVFNMFLIIMFLFKVPVFMFHIWLPKAHVDAPVEGSMILASIMLKLGGYGIYRLFYMFNLDLIICEFFFSLCIFGFFILSLLSIFILDSKILIAYSSVIHMCIMICGIFSFSLIGWWGGFLMMISHGICSSCMFLMSNMIYFRVNSRCLIYNKGFFDINPIFSYFFIAMIMFNIGAPPSMSLFSEIYSMVGLFYVDFIMFFFVVLGIFFISCSMVNLYMSLLGEGFLKIMFPLYLLDYFSLCMHFFPLLFSIFFIYMFF